MKKSSKKSETRGRKKKPASEKLLPVMTHLPPDLVEKLSQVSKWEERPVSQIVRRAVASYLNFVFGVVSGEIVSGEVQPVARYFGADLNWIVQARQDLGITSTDIRKTHEATVERIRKYGLHGGLKGGNE